MPTICAKQIRFLDKVVVEVVYQDGKIIQFDMSTMFSKYPQLKELESNRALFLSGRLDPGGFGIIWNDDLDFDAMSIYESGKVVGQVEPSLNQKIGLAIAKIRDKKGITQSELAKLSHIDQSDISRLEQGLGNPTLAKITKILEALDSNIDIITK